MNDTLMLLGRILIAVIFVHGGYDKALHADATIGYIVKANLPVPTLAWMVAVFVELVVGLAVLFGLFTRVSALGLAAWCIVTGLIYHSDFALPGMQIQLTKNLAMAGGLLYVVAFGGGAFSLDALLRRRRTRSVLTSA